MSGWARLDTDRQTVMARVRRTAVMVRECRPPQEIAHRLGVSTRTVERYRARARAEGLL